MLPSIVNLAILYDHNLFRKILKYYISEQRNVNVVIHSSNISDLLTKLNDFFVHVLVMDTIVGDLSSVEAVKIIKHAYPNLRILILCNYMEMDLLSDLLDLGVYGIISKSEEPEELERAIVALSENKVYRNKLLTEVMYWSKQNNINTASVINHINLNEREAKILQLLWNERTNKEIAAQLFLSVRSVEKIRQDLKEKLGVRSTIGMLKYAIRKKIISVDYDRNSKLGVNK